MLYGDYIELDRVTKGEMPLFRTPAKPRDPGRIAELDAADVVEGSGTGVSTGRLQLIRSFAPRQLGFAVAVLGNIVAGGLFIGALLLAPQVLARLLSLL